MPLVLSLKIDHDFYVRDERLVVVELKQQVSFTLRRQSDGKLFEITEQSAAEVAEDVFVSSGGIQSGGLLRAVIDAPKEVVITRGELIRSGPQPARRSAWP